VAGILQEGRAAHDGQVADLPGLQMAIYRARFRIASHDRTAGVMRRKAVVVTGWPLEIGFSAPHRENGRWRDLGDPVHNMPNVIDAATDHAQANTDPLQIGESR
jgi:hypothetical protein